MSRRTRRCEHGFADLLCVVAGCEHSRLSAAAARLVQREADEPAAPPVERTVGEEFAAFRRSPTTRQRALIREWQVRREWQ